MRRSELLAERELAQRHVLEGEEHLARQRELIAELKASGHNVTVAIELLGTLEQTQRLHLDSLERVQAELQREEIKDDPNRGW